MEMVSFLAGEEWSATPECSSPLVSRFCMQLNDSMGQGFRDRLQTYVPRLIGTASPRHEKERAEYLAWSAIRTFAPIAFRDAQMEGWAIRLEGLNGSLSEARIVCLEAARANNAAFVPAAASATFVPAVAASAAASAAADAVTSAARVAAAADAADAARVAADATIFTVLDGLLEIGPSGSSYTEEQKSRIEPLRNLVKQPA